MSRAGRWVALLALAASGCVDRHVLKPLGAPGWDGCGVDELAGTVRNVVCEGLDLRILRARLSGGVGVDTLAKSMPAGDATTREIIRNQRVAVPARVHPDYLIAAPRPEVFVVCRDSTPALSRCRQAILAIAENGLPPGVTFPELRTTLLGHEVAVPSGCQLVSEGIACGTTGFSVDWREQEWKEGAEAALQGGARMLRATFPHVDEERVPCALLGQRGSGAAYVLQTDAGVTYSLRCVVVRGSVASIAQCQGRAPIVAPYPSPCDQVFVAPD